jgi:GR25 family glycosyltransferase involved in LPS biosynthesis
MARSLTYVDIALQHPETLPAGAHMNTNAFEGYYINLGRSQERRERMEKQLRVVGLAGKIKRLPALEPTEGRGQLSKGEWGCLQSHIAAMAQASTHRHLILLEDDALLSPALPRVLVQLEKAWKQIDADIAFLGQTVPYLDVRTHRVLIRLMRESGDGPEASASRLLSGTLYRSGAFGYAIKANAVEKVRQRMKAMLSLDSPEPIDAYLYKLIATKAMTGLVVFPYVVGVDAELVSTMADRKGTDTHAAHCRLINQYLQGAMPYNSLSDWAQLLAGQPDPRALAIVWEVYRRLTAEEPQHQVGQLRAHV